MKTLGVCCYMVNVQGKLQRPVSNTQDRMNTQGWWGGRGGITATEQTHRGVAAAQQKHTGRGGWQLQGKQTEGLQLHAANS